MTVMPHISGAFAVVADSSWMLAAALLFVMSAEVLAAVFRTRALVLALPWSDALLRAALEETRSLRAVARHFVGQHSTQQIRQPEGSTTRSAVLMASLVVGIAGAVGLGVSGHAPQRGLPLVASLAAVVLVVGLSVRALSAARGYWPLMRQAARAMATGIAAEASLASALVVALAVVAHTGGLDALSFAEAAAIAACTTLAVRLGPLPRGLVTADVVFAVPLTWIGVPVHVALAALLIWRIGSFLVVCAATAVVHLTAPTPLRRSPERDRGRVLHRVSFGLISLLPDRIARRARATAFDAMFARSVDPWEYEADSFEARKRAQLLATIGSDTKRILEVGCANGHNLIALAGQLPGAEVIGVDVSGKAVAAARARTSHLSQIQVIEAGTATEFAHHLSEPVDCIILSEVLYYLGSVGTMRSTLGALAAIADADCRVVMVHGSADAADLHHRAVQALRLVDVEEQVVVDPCRPYVMSVAKMPKLPLGPRA